MKKLLFIVLVIFIGGNVIAQNEETTKVIDSLVKEAVANKLKNQVKLSL